MAKCKDCIHNKACRSFLVVSHSKTELDAIANVEHASLCKNFKDKSLIIELPCRVGDVLWQHSPITGEPISFKVPDMHWILNNVEEFGQTVFLTREDAERALKERKENV